MDRWIDAILPDEWSDILNPLDWNLSGSDFVHQVEILSALPGLECQDELVIAKKLLKVVLQSPQELTNDTRSHLQSDQKFSEFRSGTCQIRAKSNTKQLSSCIVLGRGEEASKPGSMRRSSTLAH